MTASSGQGDRTEPENSAQTGRICSADRRISGAYGDVIVRRSPVTLKKQCPWGWERRWIIHHHAPNYCSCPFLFLNECVCFYWDAVMSWNGAPVCKWKRCSSWKPWGQQQFAQFNPAHLGFMFCKAGREKIPPRFLWRIYLCKYWKFMMTMKICWVILSLWNSMALWIWMSAAPVQTETSQELCHETTVLRVWSLLTAILWLIL